MKFSEDYSKLQDRLFTTIRAGMPYYAYGQKIVCETPTQTFQATVLYYVVTNLLELPLRLIQYDTDNPVSSREELITWIRGLYRGKAPGPGEPWTLYILERLEVKV